MKNRWYKNLIVTTSPKNIGESINNFKALWTTVKPL